MPAEWLAAAGQAMGSFVGDIINPFFQQKTNKQSREWQEKMYGIQRQHALDDWNREAEYNSPSQQMARLKAAGLNPNLVYGHGADATMSSVRSSSPGSWNPQAPQVDFSNTTQGLGAIYDMRIKDAQIDNLAVAREVQQQDVLLKAAQTLKTLTDNRSSDFDLRMKNDLKEINVDMARESAEKQRWDAEQSEINVGLSKALYDPNIKKAYAEVHQLEQQRELTKRQADRVMQEIENLKKDGDLKQFQINLNKLGITSTDNVFLRIMTQLFGKYLPKM